MTKQIVYDSTPWQYGSEKESGKPGAAPSRKPAKTTSATMRRGALPSPGDLAKGEQTTKVTLALTDRTIAYFKQQAKQYGVPYQALIRRLLDEYSRQEG